MKRLIFIHNFWCVYLESRMLWCDIWTQNKRTWGTFTVQNAMFIGCHTLLKWLYASVSKDSEMDTVSRGSNTCNTGQLSPQLSGERFRKILAVWGGDTLLRNEWVINRMKVFLWTCWWELPCSAELTFYLRVTTVEEQQTLSTHLCFSFFF